MNKLLCYGLMSVGLPIIFAPAAYSADANTALINDAFLKNLKSYLAEEVVTLSVQNQNIHHKDLKQAGIDALDKQWRAETKSENKSLISATLSNPLSSYLTRVQAHSLGLYSEIFIMDNKGLNVGQSSVSSDFWQGDEGKWQKTFLKGADAVFIDEPEWNESTKTWRVQVNISIKDSTSSNPIGAATFEVNLTELERRGNAS